VPRKKEDLTLLKGARESEKNSSFFGMVLTAGAASADSVVYNNNFGGGLSGDNADERRLAH